MSAIAFQNAGVSIVNQPFVQAQIKENIKALRERNSQVTGEFPAQRASNAGNFPFDDVIMDAANCFERTTQQ